MELKDIIRTNKDRIFMVDPECFIIYTGSELDDPQPFIRIGNWAELPADIIPLIENIIIPDRLIGNPSNEQFNIDIDYLPTNRYIGSKGLVKRYLDYQKVFCLDLKNAEIVDAEKDIPEITAKSSISDKDSFIGIFYSDGNFKIHHNKSDLFNLSESFKTSFSDIALNEKLAEISRKIDGTGFFITEDNPVFFKQNTMVSYLFPSRYFEVFASLGINPKFISAIIHPSANYLNTSKFLKWKNYCRSKIKFFCDHSEDFDLIKRLFSDAQLSFERFTSFKYSSGGLEINGIPGSYNTEIKTDSNGKKIKYLFIKGETGFKDALKKKYDAVFISYSVFEEKSALIRSCEIPYAVIDDGNPSFAKLLKTEITALCGNAEFNIKKASREEMKNILASMLRNIPFSESDEFVTECSGYSSKTNELTNTDYFNIIAALKFIIAFSESRKTVQNAKSTLRNFLASSGHESKHRSQGTIFCVYLVNGIIINTAEGAIYREVKFISDHVSDDLPEIVSLSPQEKSTAHKIITDRTRLAELIKILITKSSHREYVNKLEDAIKRRKEIFSNKIISKDEILTSGETSANNHPVAKIPVIGKIFTSLTQKPSQYEYTAEDFQSKEEIAEICREIKNDSLKSDNFSLPQIKEGIDFLNALLRSPAFFEAWKNSSKNKSVKLPYSMRKIAEKQKALSTLDFNSLSSDDKKNLAAFNRKIIDMTYRPKIKSAETNDTSKDEILKSIVRHKKIIIPVSALLLILPLLLLFYIQKNKPIPEGDNSPENNKISVKTSETKTSSGMKTVEPPAKIDREKIERDLEKVLPSKPNLAGWDYEVFVMANRIAITNNYSPILENQFGKKNPNWIYPENIFIIPTGERIIVQKGDTLWKIAGDFLLIAHDNFTKTYQKISDQIKDGDKPDKKLIAEAKNWAFTGHDKALLKSVSER
ncbi:MAG: hypothetical protein KBH06_01740 [Spirochaetes bacterium]|nr:hypothetical protein [Spirochaetota bacterium]